MFRIGIGNDTHRLVEGRPLVLGGVHVASDRGAKAIRMPMLCFTRSPTRFWARFVKVISASHFPDNDPQWKDANSLQLLSRVVWLAHERGLTWSMSMRRHARSTQSSDLMYFPCAKRLPRFWESILPV